MAEIKQPIYIPRSHQKQYCAGFIQSLNTHEGLYGAVVRALDLHTKHKAQESPTSDAEAFSEEAVLVGKLLRADFERSGIHLEPHQRTHLAVLQERIQMTGFQLGGAFILENDTYEARKVPGIWLNRSLM